jgi:leucine dehydrogenase
MSLFDTMYAEDHEQVVFCADRAAGLKALIVIHDTTLGPSLGGIRMRAYASEADAVTDAVRLAQAMTFKAALAGLDYGGGKAVVIGDQTTPQREALFRALGRAIESLGGRYIPTEDMGTTTADIERVRKESRFGVGRDEVFGGGGDPSPMTAWGIFCGLRACLEEIEGTAEFRGKTVAVQGLGKVGYALARFLHEAGATLTVADVDISRTQRAATELHARVVGSEEILFQPCDILAPCAAGGIFQRDTIPRLRCRIIGGGANNQLLSDEDGDALQARGIFYAPDFAINAGGLINVADELGPGGYRRKRAKAKTEAIYATLKTIFAEAKRREVPPHRLAVTLAQERIQAVRNLRRLNPVLPSSSM